LSISDPKYLHLKPGQALPDNPMGKPYSAALVIEANVTSDWRNMVSQWLVESNCLTMMAWGKDCSLWDDAVDIANLEQFDYDDIPDDKSVMTMWHDKEDIIDFFASASWNIFNLHESAKNQLLIIDISENPRETEILKLYEFSRCIEVEEPNSNSLRERFGKIFKSIRFVQTTFFLLFVFGSFFGWHIHTVYRMAVGSSPIGEPLFPQETLEDYGQKIVAELTAKNVQAAIISRAGQPRDKLPTGVEFTHSAFWLYEPRGDEPHYAVYNLYHGEENRLISSLVKDEPADFLRLTREHDVGIIIPTQATQTALINYIGSPRYGEVHQINYSLISNPLDARFQNCNEFMLDSLAAIMWGTPNSATIKTTLEEFIEPTELKASFIRRKIGPVVDERLIMDDHEDRIFTTTRKTLAQFLDSQDALEQAYILKLR